MRKAFICGLISMMGLFCIFNTYAICAQFPRLVSYWCAYRPFYPIWSNSKTWEKVYDTPTLDSTASYVDVVNVAFALVRPNNKISTDFLTCFSKDYGINSSDSIKAQIKYLQSKGIKVILSVGGWAGNCWTTVTDEKMLANNLINVMNTWGFDGINLDYEGDINFNSCDYPEVTDWAPVEDQGKINPDSYLSSFVQYLKSHLGNGKLLTAVTYNTPYDQYVLDNLSSFDWVETDNYWDRSFYDGLVQKYPNTKFILGVSCSDPTMSLSSISTWATGLNSMMLWDLSEDNNGFTQQADGIYLSTINSSLPLCYK